MTQPKLANTSTSGRTYEIQGSTLPSVTTILGILAKPGIYKSRENAIARAALCDTPQAILANEGEDAAFAWLLEQANIRRDEASMRGSDVHHALDVRVKYGGWSADYTRWDTPETTRTFTHESIRGYCAAFDAFLKEHKPKFLLTEATVYGDDYAGTLDAIVEIGGKVYVVDYKSGYVAETAALQLAAYAYAKWVADDSEHGHALWTHTNGQRPDGAFVLDVKDTGEYRIVKVKDLPQAWKDFNAVRAAYTFVRRKKSEVLERPGKKL